MLNRIKQKHKNASGFTLVEVLVALVVLAVGMLGIASLYVTTLRSGSSAINRMQAINLASDLADKIRANRNAAVAYAGAGSNGKVCVGSAVTCSPQEMAAFDLFTWAAQISNTLPSGATGNVAFTAGSPNVYVIKITWSEPSESNLSYELQMQL
jgi:type IV pilus assembly protein PilV